MRRAGNRARATRKKRRNPLEVLPAIEAPRVRGSLQPEDDAEPLVLVCTAADLAKSKVGEAEFAECRVCGDATLIPAWADGRCFGCATDEADEPEWLPSPNRIVLTDYEEPDSTQSAIVDLFDEAQLSVSEYRTIAHFTGANGCFTMVRRPPGAQREYTLRRPTMPREQWLAECARVRVAREAIRDEARAQRELRNQERERRRAEADALKNPFAVALGRAGGLKGGAARAKSLSPEQRRESARLAAMRRWYGKDAE